MNDIFSKITLYNQDDLEESKDNDDSVQLIQNIESNAQMMNENVETIHKFVNGNILPPDQDLQQDAQTVRHSWRFLRNAASTTLAILYIVGSAIGGTVLTVLETH